MPSIRLAHLVLMRMQPHLLKYQRHEQSWFTLGNSTIDPVHSGIRQGCVLASLLFSSSMEFDKVLDQSRCGASADIKIIDLVLADDAARTRWRSW